MITAKHLGEVLKKAPKHAKVVYSPLTLEYHQNNPVDETNYVLVSVDVFFQRLHLDIIWDECGWRTLPNNTAESVLALLDKKYLAGELDLNAPVEASDDDRLAGYSTIKHAIYEDGYVVLLHG